MKHFVLILFFLTTLKVSAQTLESDRLALVALYNATGGPNWINKTGWTVPGTVGDNPCSWYGVTCNAAGRVEELNLEKNNLGHELPGDIGDLTELKSLKLKGFDFGPIGEGSDAWNYLDGSIPPQIGNLAKLEHLDLSGNYFTGTIPTSLGNLTFLKHLDLNYEPMDVPFDPNGLLEGSIPGELGSLANLEYLGLARQSFSGNIPSQLGNLSKLKYLNLENNLLNGSIPAGLGALSELAYLNLGFYFRQPAEGDNPNEYVMFGKLNGIIPDLSGLPANAKVYLNNQSFTFYGMEENINRLVQYSPQQKIKLIVQVPLSGGSFGTGYVDAGGDVANNTYKWFKDNVLIKTIVGNEYYDFPAEGLYRAEVTNSKVPGLTLITDEVDVYVLPVTLVSFVAKNKGGKNVLSWKTTSETDNSGFQVERSHDAINFEKIGFFDGNGDTQLQKQYSFTDENPLTQSYYRLKQIDHSGKFEYSRTIAVENTGLDLAIYPNPASDYILVKNLGPGNEIVIRDLNGKVLIDSRITSGKAIDIRSLSNGIYLMTIGDVTKKLMVRK